MRRGRLMREDEDERGPSRQGARARQTRGEGKSERREWIVKVREEAGA